MKSSPISYKRHRFPPQIIAHAVWLYIRFNLSLREVEEMLLQRGIDASYETIRRWVSKFGPQIARNLRHRQDRPGELSQTFHELMWRYGFVVDFPVFWRRAMAISFKGAHFPKGVILFAVFFYVRFGVSYRDLEEILAERGVKVDHATLNRWVAKYASQVAAEARRRKRPADRSWRMDETYIRVKGK